MDSAKQLNELSKVYLEAVYGKSPEQVEAERRKKDDLAGSPLVVTNADKKANTKAYQNFKAGKKGYKAADHLGEGIKGEDNETRKAAAAERKKGIKTRLSPSEGRANVANMLFKIKTAKSNPQNESVSEGKKAKKDFDGDGQLESPEAEYKGSKDKAIKKELKDLQKAANTLKGVNVAKADVVPGVGYKEETILEKQKDTPKQVAAVIDYYRSKKGTGEAVKDTEEGDDKDAKKERDYAAWERSKMKKDDPDWKHKKGSTSESVEADKYIETVQQIKQGELEDDIKRWEQLTSSGKFTKEEIDNLAWNEFDEGYQRDPEGGEEKERKAKRERKGGYDEKRERRMNDPKTGINSPAFREFMRSRGM